MRYICGVMNVEHDEQAIEAAFLEAGLNLYAASRIEALPENVRHALQQEVGAAFKTLVVLGNGGSHFWRRYRQYEPDECNPIDSYCQQIVSRVAEQFFPDHLLKQLYPGPTCVPLQTLGRHFGWHGDSPLGLGVNGLWGPWSAYRAMFVTTCVLPDTAPVAWGAVCAHCESQSCVAACPADALTMQGLPDMQACTIYRVQGGSRCDASCAARVACPVGQEHRYSEEQLAYHHQDALAGLRRYYMP